MANAFLGHEAQTFFDPFIRVRHAQISRHDLGNFGFARTLAAQDNLARVIALRKHSDQTGAFHDQERTDIFVVHHFDGFENQGVGRDRINLRTLLVQDRANCSAHIHKPTTRGVVR